MVLYEEVALEVAKGGYIGKVLDSTYQMGLEVAAPLRVWLAERGVEYASYIIEVV